MEPHQKNLLQQVYDPESFRQSGHELVDFLADQLQTMTAGTNEQTLPWASPAEVLAEVDSWSELPTTEMFAQVFGRSIRLHDPRYMGHQLMPPAPVAALAGLFNDFFNNGMGVYEMGPAGSAIEQWLIQHITRRFGLGDKAGGFMTHGGTLANLTGMLAARAKQVPAAWQTGEPANLALMVSQQAHYCMDRAARVMGWGEGGVIRIPCDEQYRMRTDLLTEQLANAKAAGKQVIAVVGSACTTSTGSFDDLRAIGQFCQQHDLWFHVDGAHAAAVAFSEKYRSRVDGLELANSVAMDFHKMLLTPSVSSALLFRDGSDAYRTFAQEADYLLQQQSVDDPWHDMARRTFECTKTMLGLKVFSVVSAHGWEVFDQSTTQLIDLALDFADLIEAADDFELAIRPQANILCFRFVGVGTDAESVSATNAAIRKSLLEDGEFYLVQTSLDGETWLRTTISNPLSETRHFHQLLDRIREVAVADVRES